MESGEGPEGVQTKTKHAKLLAIDPGTARSSQAFSRPRKRLCPGRPHNKTSTPSTPVLASRSNCKTSCSQAHVAKAATAPKHFKTSSGTLLAQTCCSSQHSAGLDIVVTGVLDEVMHDALHRIFGPKQSCAVLQENEASPISKNSNKS